MKSNHAVAHDAPGTEPALEGSFTVSGLEIGADDESLATRSAAIRHHVKSMIGVTCNVAVKRPGEVPRSQGKAVRVRDLREV